MLLIYASAPLGPAVRQTARGLRAGELTVLGLMLCCLSAANDLAELSTLGIVTVTVVASSGLIAQLLLSIEDVTVTAEPVDEAAQILSLPSADANLRRISHLRVLQVQVGTRALGTRTA